MKILIVGSDGTPAHNQFATACQEIGAALARAKIEIVIGSDNPKTADFHVLRGAAEVEGCHRVTILCPSSGPMPFAEQRVMYANKLMFFQKRLRGSWSAGRVTQILAADAVLLIGGGKGTQSTGYVAPALERPVVVIGSFGGAASDLWPEFESYYSRLGDLSHAVGDLRENWRSENAELAVKVAIELIKRRTFRVKPRLPLGVFLSLLLACLMIWVGLFANPMKNEVYSFFAMLAVAGFLGTFLRNSLRLIFDPTAIFSWEELFIELGAGLLLGFALALLYFIGSLTITGATDAVLIPKDISTFQRVAVVMTLLGLGGSLMIEQARDKVQKWISDQFQ